MTDTPSASDAEAPLRQAAPLWGAALIKDEVTRLPDAPGVYRMIGEADEVLYVGKAKSLKKRVVQYAQGRFHTNRIANMVDATRAMEFITTRTEADALLLEINLIKQLKPRFNVLLRDDKSFPEIVIRRDHDAPQLRKHRGAHTIKGDYFGPFASAWAVNRTLNTLQKAFLLRSCSDSVYDSRDRPCMLYQIKRCAAPCTGLIGKDDYQALVDQAEAFLRGKSRAVMATMAKAMEEAAEELEFERAARLRDRIRALSAVAQETQINPETVEEADVVALHVEGGQACVQVFFFRAGQNWGNRAYFPRITGAADDPEDETVTEEQRIITAFLGQFYDDKPIPRLILANVQPAESELLSEAFALKSGRKVEIAVPKRGEKADLVQHVLTNAREALGRKMAEGSAQTKLLAGVAEAFKLDAPPERIEVYDNSHIQGANAVGGMIVAGPEGFMKGQYRKFNIKSTELTPGDDYGMMKEVLRRRFARLVKEEEEGDDANRPDLVLVDGGQGQLDAAIEIMADLGVDDIAVVGVAKGPDRDAGLERFFIPGQTPFMLEPKSPVLYYLQRLRDEAHRFAIGAHRTRRSMDLKKNPLDEIEGVGPGRKKALLHAFGSAKGVGRASVEDLVKVDGVSQALAERIFGFFRKG
ncbi:excinuclease ABC subunit UvrC [Caulobacter vibrioides]|uniref:UvrABC system protein C n=2 Tax=Caulobacter vibrioides TaxID=155892 RepID=UVRC_CAUVC|nr:excinuclease ABC subunit UvrC [Caulobacter vibrioides]YP_002518348.1 excinuclease ABC subunit C [Caulobacter vibrioides NA1000]Q9A4F3.1 RecName: Full=UvrABC system protein C; Short=Protein UvrC; AltName: Full=Excinuclease ABC subunit C [Caulobacter vibrioides CB15]QBQ57320.1 excinuclease ABC subunit UvrC [synthetic Caulobacter sp. 'ethensis']AAK24845.1 excinuclease ABC, subunit C [Caulobacter vibrioides CB15]ACL96440.1 excinuclease ABC subunit C [Caulobacter vibrioides NA1000]ATC29716.1 Uv